MPTQFDFSLLALLLVASAAITLGLGLYALLGRRIAVSALRASEERFRAVFRNLPIPTYSWHCNKAGVFTLAAYNVAAERATGGAVAHMLGKDATLMYADRPDILADLARCVAERQSFGREMPYHFATGDRMLDVTYAFVPPDLVTVHSVDITERKRTEAKLIHQALYDVLTDLPNRHLLKQRLNAALAKPTSDACGPALLLLDLDRFKEINDTLGHQAGDVLLQQIGTRLQGVVRNADLVGRLGGDEFAVLLPETDARGAAQIADKVVHALQRPFALDGQPIAVDASIGIAVAPGHAQDADGLLRCADVAMYQAKRSGTGVVVYHAEEDEHRLNHLALLGELRTAIDHDELLLHFQPKLSLRDGTLVGVEALVRWQHPQRGFLPPSEFIPLAEQTGLIYPLTRWVLEAALKQQHVWRAAGRDIPVAVNLSRRSLHDPTLPERVADALARWKVPAGSLVLEITESGLIADPARAADNLNKLRALGVRISIDDFGTGYSSMASLKNLSVDELKIDQSFVRAMATDASSRAIVRAITDLANALNLRVVAEGIEDRATWDVLASLGCDIAQGYFVSRPIAAAELDTWIRTLSPTWLTIAQRPNAEEALQERIRGRGARLTAEEEFIARKQAEAALHASEERNRMALEAARMGTWEFDLVNGLSTWSPEMEALQGCAPGTFDGTSADVQRTIQPEDWLAFANEVKASISEHREGSVTYRVVWPDASVHWLESRGRASYAADGTPELMRGTTMDVTERKQSDAALRTSQEHIHLALAAAGMGTWDWDLIHDVVTASAETEILHGLLPGTFEGTSAALQRTVHPDDWPGMLAEMQAAVVQHRESTSTYRTVWPDGTEHWLEAKCRGLYAADGTFQQVTGTSMDITERRQSLSALNEERATLAAVMGSMTDGLIVMGGADAARILFSNARAADLLGVAPEHLSATPGVMTILTESRLEDPSAAAIQWGAALAHLEDRPSFEATVRGSPPHNLLVQLFQVPSAAGVQGRIGILLRDVTAERAVMRTRERVTVRP